MTDPFAEAFEHGSENGHCPGLTKREYFAALAMQGHLAQLTMHEWSELEPADIALEAVRSANALVAALNKENTND